MHLLEKKAENLWTIHPFQEPGKNNSKLNPKTKAESK